MLSCVWLAATFTAHAADDGDAVDLTREFVFANAETISMGGAGSAFAFGGNGMVLSPAAPANRRKEVTSRVFTSGTFNVTSTWDNRDLWNLGEPSAESGYIYHLTGTLGIRRTAVGVLAGGTWYQLPNSFFGNIDAHANVARTFLDGRFVVGVGARFLGVRSVSETEEHADHLGAGVEMGAIVPNVWEHWNFALTLRSGVSANTSSDLYVPFDRAAVAPQGSIGVGWSSSADARPDVRLAGDLVVDGPVENGVSLEKLLDDEVVPRGEHTTVSPRAGAEVEVWPDRLRLRGGGYLEPSRTDLSNARMHVTVGYELHLFELKALDGRAKFDLAWQMGADVAPRYWRFALIGLNIWGTGAVGGMYAPPGVD
jgi:hypothetical protein